MTAPRVLALRAIRTALATVPGFSGLKVHRNPHWPIKVYPTIAMFDGPMRPVEETNEVTVHEMDVLVDFYTECAAGADIDEAGATAGDQASEIYAAAIKTVFADAGVVAATHDRFEGPMNWDLLPEEAAVPHILVSVEMQIRIQTARDDPSLPPSV